MQKSKIKMQNNEKKFKIKLAENDLELEIGKMAELASAAVTAKYGETVVLATVVVGEEPKESASFFPMMVDYEERWYATGKISGSRFVKRETRPSEEATLAARMIDRPLRPLFPKDYRNDVQIIITVLSADLEHDPVVVGMIAASTALMLSPAPFEGPVGAVRVGKIDGKLKINPKMSQMENSDLDLIVAGTNEAVIMFSGKAKEISEADFLKAGKVGFSALQPIIDLQKKICQKLKIPKANHVAPQKELEKKVSKFLGDKLAKLAAEVNVEKRQEGASEFEKEVLTNFEGTYKQVDIKSIFEKKLEAEIRKSILKKGIRPDGRKPDEVRPISVEVGLLPRTHGSALFKRGQTQVLTVTTLGSPSREQVIETMGEEATKRYMHHYNFPPFSVGEISPLRGASRREIGHGALAEKALGAVTPKKELFPYTIRVASEVLSSNGSTSMAAVCGSSLSLMDAGVPIKEPVAGIALGLILEGKKHIILTDIMGIEDFAGDMDFKIAGTKNGMTAFQMDVKTDKINFDIIDSVLEQGEKARLQILEEMNQVISKSRKQLSEHAPTVSVIKIHPDRIRDVIGPGGKVINRIIDQTSTAIDIEPDGTATISGQKNDGVQKAKNWISDLTHEVKVDEVFSGKVTRILDFGAFVEILPGQEGLIHISKLAPYRVKKVSDVVKVGDVVPVKVIEIDSQGRINLSLQAAKSKKQ